jgi:phage anti-repressor protein
MQELVKVETNSEGKQVVSARELYHYLGYDKSQWARWYKKNIEENAFAIEKEDWEGFDTVSSSNNGLTTKDFAITLDFAKRISMMARTEKGEEARSYFIACETKVKELAKPMSQIDILVMSVQLLQKQAQEIAEVKSEMQELKAKQSIRDEAYYTVSGYASIRGIKIDSSKANLLGRKCVKESREADVHIGTVHDSHYGKINSYHLDILSVVFEKEFKK